MTPDTLGRKRQRGQRILDLVRDATRYLAPCRLLLGAQNVGQVFQHDYVSRALAAVAGRLRRRVEGGDGDGDIQPHPAGDDLHLAGGASHAIGFAEHVQKIGLGLSGKQVVAARWA